MTFNDYHVACHVAFFFIMQTGRIAPVSEYIIPAETGVLWMVSYAGSVSTVVANRYLLITNSKKIIKTLNSLTNRSHEKINH